MAPSSRYSLPAFTLWMSVVVSAALAGSMVPLARNLPLIIYLMCFTAVYHSGLLVSSLTVDAKPNTRASFYYVDPLESSNMIWTLCFGVFWLTNCVMQINALTKGAGEDRDYFLAIFSCIEWMLNARIIYLSLMAWRDPEIRYNQVSDLESGLAREGFERDEEVLAIMHFLQASLPPLEPEDISKPSDVSEPPNYSSSFSEPSVKDGPLKDSEWYQEKL